MTKSHTENQPGSVQKGNTTAIPETPQLLQPTKNPIGRPPKYKTAEALQAKIEEYFLTGLTLRKVLIGPPANRKEVLIPVPTISGLVLYCGYKDRKAFEDMEKRPEFSPTIKAARTRIIQNYEELLQTAACTGAIFALKNFGWIDTPQIDQSIHYHLTYGYRTRPVNRTIRPASRPSQLT